MSEDWHAMCSIKNYEKYKINLCTRIREADANNPLRLMVKLAISLMTAISLSLTSTVLADHYNDLVVQGYRWVTADGPYICHAEENVRQLVAHRTDGKDRARRQ